MRSALTSTEPPQYRRAPKGSLADAFETEIRNSLAEYPTMPATVIADLWLPKSPIPLGGGQGAQLPVLVMTLAFSHFISPEIVPHAQPKTSWSGCSCCCASSGR